MGALLLAGPWAVMPALNVWGNFRGCPHDEVPAI